MKFRQISTLFLLIAAVPCFGFRLEENTSRPAVTATQDEAELKVGDVAPDFELTDQNGEKVRLSDFKGKKKVVLAFYVLAFTGG